MDRISKNQSTSFSSGTVVLPKRVPRMALKVSVFFCGDFHDGVIPLVAQLFDLKLGVGIPFEAALVASGSYTASRFFFFFWGGS